MIFVSLKIVEIPRNAMAARLRFGKLKGGDAAPYD